MKGMVTKMEVNRFAIKMQAKYTISETKPHPVLVLLVWVLISYILTSLTFSLSGYYKYVNNLFSVSYYGDWNEQAVFIPSVSVIGWILITAMSLMSMVLDMGTILYSLNVSRKRRSGVGNLFDCFGIFFKVIGLMIVIGFFTTLWSLLFIIPGIVASYRYRLAPYIMIDNPQMPIMECIRQSKRMMTGRKGELFVLDLSFIGWYLLTIVPFVSLWVTPYTLITYAIYYNSILDLDAKNAFIPNPPHWNGEAPAYGTPPPESKSDEASPKPDISPEDPESGED